MNSESQLDEELGGKLNQVLLRKGLFAQDSVGFIAPYRGRTSHSSYPEHGINPAPAVTAMTTLTG